ncbi:MAG: M56 family metallopeptidase [Gemmatimonadota bacterium]
MSETVWWARALGWALMLSLVQGALIAAGVFVLLGHGRSWRPALRQGVAQAAQVALVLLFVAGAYALKQSWQAAGDSVPSILPQLRGASTPALLASTAVSERPFLVEALRFADRSAAWLSALWLVGVLWFGLRLMREWRGVRSMLRGARKRGDLQPVVQQVRAVLGVRTPITAVQAALSSPGVLGWTRATVILPSELEATLTPEQLRAVIAHEVAHVQRGDYVLHVAEAMLGVLFFYHPAMDYLIATSRATREEACDDLAVRVCGSPLVYARALERMESVRHGRVMAPALALTDGQLLARVRRLIVQRTERGFAASMLPGMMTVSALALAFALVLPAAVAPAVPIARLRDRLVRIQAEDPAGQFTVTMVNGTVLGASIEGRAVPPERLQQRQDELLFLRSDGGIDFAVNLRLNGISWRPRPRAAPSS